MAVSQDGAGYRRRAEIRQIPTYGKFLAEALDDLASQTRAVANQTNSNTHGAQTAPNAPASLAVSVANGIFTATITDAAAKAGTAYLLEYDTAPNFTNPITVDLGIAKRWSANLKGLALYFRAASTFYTSSASPWTYFGSAQTPTKLQG